jgi:hypothetical protein
MLRHRDITDIPMEKENACQMAIIDWHSRAMLVWEISMDGRGAKDGQRVQRASVAKSEIRNDAALEATQLSRNSMKKTKDQ